MAALDDAELAELLHDEEEMSLTAGLDMSGRGPDGPPCPIDDDDDDDDDRGATAVEAAEAAAEAASAREGLRLLHARSADPADGETQPCVHCGRGTGGAFFEAFAVAACKPCRALNPNDYKLVTHKYCKSELLLTDRMLESIGTLKVPNPHKKSYNPMRLYLRSQVDAAALREWGSEAALRAERTRRGDAKLAKKVASAKRAGARVLLPVAKGRGRTTEGVDVPGHAADAHPGPAKRARGAVAGSAPGVHEHQFDGREELVDADNDIYARTCTICQCVCTYEKL